MTKSVICDMLSVVHEDYYVYLFYLKFMVLRISWTISCLWKLSYLFVQFIQQIFNVTMLSHNSVDCDKNWENNLFTNATLYKYLFTLQILSIVYKY